MSTRALKILVLEDNDDLRTGWLTYFQIQGHAVRGIAMADELLGMSAEFCPDVYVIDLNLPDADGLDVVRRLRAAHPGVGIVITTARSNIGDKMEGYGSGADMYLTKPIAPQELMAGISALAKRLYPRAAPEDHLRLLLDQQTLRGPAGTLELTPSETTLLASFTRAGGVPLARWQIAELLGLCQELPSDAMLEMRIARLRKKLVTAGADEPAIRAVHKRGYVLACKVLLE